MPDCEQVSDNFPIRQGDILKRVRPLENSGMVIVITADCDIAKNKIGDSGITCVQLLPLADYMLLEHSKTIADRQIKKRFEKFSEWINCRWLEIGPENLAISDERIQSWVQEASAEEIMRVLHITNEAKITFLRREVNALTEACKYVNSVDDRLSGIDALRCLQTKSTSRGEQLKTLFSTIDPSSLPLDVFFVSSVPGEPGVGFIAKLRSLNFIPLDCSFTSMAVAQDHDNAFLRVGRLTPTFRHGLAQQFGMLFARIGFPADYEADRDTAFAVVYDELLKEMKE